MKKNGFPDLSKYEIFQKMESDEFITLVYKRIHKDFLLDITGEMETVPELGDLTIFGDQGKESLYSTIDGKGVCGTIPRIPV